MDFATATRLRDGMADTPKPDPHDDLVRQLFYLLTARFEDGAAVAAEGQAARVDADRRIELANRLHSFAQEAITLADAICALTFHPDHPETDAAGPV